MFWFWQFQNTTSNTYNSLTHLWQVVEGLQQSLLLWKRHWLSFWSHFQHWPNPRNTEKSRFDKTVKYWKFSGVNFCFYCIFIKKFIPTVAFWSLYPLCLILISVGSYVVNDLFVLVPDKVILINIWSLYPVILISVVYCMYICQFI